MILSNLKLKLTVFLAQLTLRIDFRSRRHGWLSLKHFGSVKVLPQLLKHSGLFTYIVTLYSSKKMGVLDSVDDVDIEEGRFKYILIQLLAGSQKKYIVRGYGRCGYHADILDEVQPALENRGITCNCVGGGRIEHSKAEKTILVYGYSMGFGQADHRITVEILKKRYPGYTKITFSNEGY